VIQVQAFVFHLQFISNKNSEEAAKGPARGRCSTEQGTTLPLASGDGGRATSEATAPDGDSPGGTQPSQEDRGVPDDCRIDNSIFGNPIWYHIRPEVAFKDCFVDAPVTWRKLGADFVWVGPAPPQVADLNQLFSNVPHDDGDSIPATLPAPGIWIRDSGYWNRALRFRDWCFLGPQPPTQMQLYSLLDDEEEDSLRSSLPGTGQEGQGPEQTTGQDHAD
jgi:hypothetical protein